ncbi:MAG: hypothetical protein IT225_03670 [Flavobacteriales bacterium]|nr:hypothetical protein [Flavobacteriales bacterium]
MIGFIPTEPVSIPPTGIEVGALRLDVTGVRDTMNLSATGHPSYSVHDVRHTAEYALSRAFGSTTHIVNLEASEAPAHELRVIVLSSNYYPMGYYANTEYKDNPLSFGPRTTHSTTEYRPYSIDTQYKALLYSSDSLVAVFEGVVNSPGLWDMPMNLKKAMERVAEHLNTEVVQFFLKQKGG